MDSFSQGTKIGQIAHLLFLYRMHRFVLTMIVASCYVTTTFAQKGSGSTLPTTTVDTTTTQMELESFVDTFGAYYFYRDAPGEVRAIVDTAINKHTHHYDAALKENYALMNLGLPGSASQSMLYQQPYRQGFDVGFHQFDAYKKGHTSMPFYYIEKPITMLAYSQLGEQENGAIDVKFARNFARGIQITLDYSRLSMLGRNFLTPNSFLRNTTFRTGMWYHSKNDRYDAFAVFAANTFEHKLNGGVDSLPPRDIALNNPFYAIANLQQGELRHSYRDYSFTQSYQLKKATRDSLGREGNLVAVTHEIAFLNNKYKFFAPRAEADTLFYNAHPIFDIDYRGMRSLIHDREWRNRFAIMWSSPKRLGHTPISDTPNHLEAGITYAKHYLDIEGSGTHDIDRAFVDGKWHLRLGQHIQLKTKGHLGLLKYAGDYRLDARMILNLGKMGQLEAYLINQLYSPSVVAQEFTLFDDKLWQNDWEKTLGSQLGGRYSLPQYNASVTANYHLVYNYVYYKTTGEPQQTGEPISILQLELTKDFLWKHFGWNNQIGVQFVSDDAIQLPRLVGQHSLFYRGKWFDVLNVRMGVDLRYNDTYKASYFQPVTGQFQLQDTALIPFYPNFDAWLSMQVSNFRFYAKYENATYQFIRDRSYYPTAFYPNMPSGLRLGLKWKLVN